MSTPDEFYFAPLSAIEQAVSTYPTQISCSNEWSHL